MRDHLYIFLFMLHFSTGCIVSNVEHMIVITGYTGGSVVLPCSCADPQSTVTTFSWEFKEKQLVQVFEDERYSGRRVLFNERSPTNLSLLISDLRMDDQGYYSCMTNSNSITYVDLQVKGCDLVENRRTVAVTGYSGESVVLHCSCTELLAKPQQIQWMYFIKNRYKEIYPNEQIENYKNRVKLLNPNTPGNLSLHISALTTEDQGDYQCFVSSQQAVAFRLTVLHTEEKPHVHIISLSTHQPSHQTQDLPPHQQSHQTQDLPPPQQSHQTQDLPPPQQSHHTQELPPHQQSHQTQDLPPPQQSHHTQELPPHQQSDRTQDLPPPQQSDQTQDLPPPQPSHQTQDLPPPQPSHHTPQYVFILVAVFSVVLLLAFLALSSRYGEDEVACSDVVYVKTTSTPAHAQNDPVVPEYVNAKTNQT